MLFEEVYVIFYNYNASQCLIKNIKDQFNISMGFLTFKRLCMIQLRDKVIKATRAKRNISN